MTLQESVQVIALHHQTRLAISVTPDAGITKSTSTKRRPELRPWSTRLTRALYKDLCVLSNKSTDHGTVTFFRVDQLTGFSGSGESFRAMLQAVFLG